MIKTKTTKIEKKVKKTEKPTKTQKVKVVKPEEKPGYPLGQEKYLETEGRRKTSAARVRLFTLGEKTFSINGKPLNQYFPAFELQEIAKSSLQLMKCDDKFGISVIVKGGGLHSQSEAIRHGIARALILFNPDFRKRLKKAGFLTRDSRMRERKKFGLKRARRAPQWQKR